MKYLFYLPLLLLLIIGCEGTVDIGPPAKIDAKVVYLGHYKLIIPGDWSETTTTCLVEFSPKKSPDYHIVGYRLEGKAEENIALWEELYSDIDKKQQLELPGGAMGMFMVGAIQRKLHADAPSVMLPEYAVLLGYIPAESGSYCFVMEGPLFIVEGEVESFREFLNSATKMDKVVADIEHQSPPNHPHNLEGEEEEIAEPERMEMGNTLAYADFQLEVPEAWQATRPESQMRLVELALRDSTEHKVVGFHFGSLGLEHDEMVKRNIERWEGQFTKLDEKRDIPLKAPKGVVLVQLTGTFSAPPMMGGAGVPMENQTMLAAILPSSEGPYYFRLVAPKEVAAKHLDNFVAFLNSYKKREPGVQSGDESISYANFSLALPVGWTKRDARAPMRLIELVSQQNPQYAIVGFYFGRGQMAEEQVVAQNLARWKGQFTKLDSEKTIPLQANGVVLFHLTGTFLKKDRPMADKGVPTPGYAMLAAVVSSNEGPYYFRLVAPATIAAQEMDNFIAFLNSYTTK